MCDRVIYLFCLSLYGNYYIFQHRDSWALGKPESLFALYQVSEEPFLEDVWIQTRKIYANVRFQDAVEKYSTALIEGKSLYKLGKENEEFLTLLTSHKNTIQMQVIMLSLLRVIYSFSIHIYRFNLNKHLPFKIGSSIWQRVSLQKI